MKSARTASTTVTDERQRLKTEESATQKANRWAAWMKVMTPVAQDNMKRLNETGKDIVAAGGSVIAQDEATSVVWGMPGAAANAGICAAILPLNQIAPKLVRLFSGDRS